jgi:hypothetical protein
VLQQDELVLSARGRLLVTDPERLARWGAG